MSLKSSPANPRVTESLAMDHYRLHIIERWPEGAHKDAALSSVRCSLAGLFRRSEFSAPRFLEVHRLRSRDGEE